MVCLSDNTKKNRVLYFDVLNILSCMAVIFLHHNGIVHTFQNSPAWRESLVVECAFYWAVPVFLMISGANLLNYRERYSTIDFFKKRVLRTVIPWLFWSVAVLVWKTQTGQLELKTRTIRHILGLILNYKIESVYWFFGALFACYLAIPVFSVVIKVRRVLWYIVGLNFGLLSVLPVLKTWFGFSWSLDVPVVGSLIIYILLGYLLATEQFSRMKRILIYLAGISGFVFRLIYTWFFSMQNEKTDTSIKGYAIFHSVFLAVAVFEWGKNVQWEKLLPARLIRWLPTISSCSFGIYLIHRVVMYYEQIGSKISVLSHMWRFAFVPVTYLICLGMVLILRKIPYIGKFIC